MYLLKDLRWFAARVLEKASGWFTVPFMKIGNDQDIRCPRPAADREMLPAGQTVHHSREYPSALVLPVIRL
jgi:hypothetical protein